MSAPTSNDKIETESRASDTQSIFFTLPPELRDAVYDYLAADTFLKRRDLCHSARLQTPSILLVSKKMHAECTAVAIKRAPFFLNLPVLVWHDYPSKLTCPKLDIAFPKVNSRPHRDAVIATPVRRLCLRVGMENRGLEWFQPSTGIRCSELKATKWFPQLLERLQGCSALTELAIRWCMPPDQDDYRVTQAMHLILNKLTSTVESMPNLMRYSVQVGADSHHVSEVPWWGVAMLSAYGRRGKGRQWDDDETIRFCCQEMPSGEWLEFLDDLHIDRKSQLST